MRYHIPKTQVGRFFTFVIVSAMVIIPGSSKIGTFRYSFSWSMYNGSWSYESYVLLTRDNKFVVKNRNEILRITNTHILPYGSQPLKKICKTFLNVQSVTRIGRFNQNITCNI
jgi:hypothetical protein